jgi:1-acyl-sn-glycerol-3-phosphate acyltransferase
VTGSSRFWYPVIRFVLRTLFRLCGGFRVEGAEHLPREGGVLLAANHISYGDPPALGVASPRPAWFMAKKSLFHSPLLAWVLRFGNAFPVDPEGVDRTALRTAQELLDRGEVVAIFPEGAISPTGELQPFFPGFALIAMRSRAPVVPVALLGTDRVMPYGVVLPRSARGGVTVRFGAPLDLTAPPPDLDRRERLDWATGRVRAAIEALLRPAEGQGSMAMGTGKSVNP